MRCKISFLIVFFLSILTAHARISRDRVLFISSYHTAFDSVPHQVRGIKETLDVYNIVPDVEFMDTKRFLDDRNTELFRTYLEYKMNHLPPYDVVLAGDDNALDFIISNRDQLFKNIPVVFLCINDIDRAARAVQSGSMTGIIEEQSLAETIEMAVSFNPEAVRVISIVDDTLTGKGDQAQFTAVSHQFPNLSFEIINSSLMTFEQVAEKISLLDNTSILLYQSMFTDKLNNPLTIKEAVQLISKAAKIPVYRASIGGVGQGLLGGKLIPYYDHGKTAAEMVMKILQGTPVSSIPPVMESPNKYVLDFVMLQKYKIPLHLIPAGAELINKPVSFFEVHKTEITIIIVVIVFLFVILLTALRDNFKLRGIERRLQLSESRFKYLALHDPLTELANRTALQQWIDERFSDVPDGSRRGSLLYLDFDNFKTINDAFGHDTGDLILKEIGGRLKLFTGFDVCLARVGGDEFAASLWMDDIEHETISLYHRIQKSLEQPCVFEDKIFYVTASCGIVYSPDHGTAFRELLRNVDSALYQAKKLGRNQCIIFNTEMNCGLKEKLEILQDLRRALTNREFVVHYQPQIDLGDDTVIGYEALVRWNDPVKGLKSPDYFIPAAEEGGLIGRIGSQVLEQVCQFVQKMIGEGISLGKVSVNISIYQLQKETFVHEVLSVIGRYNIPRNVIMLEITETALMNNLNTAVERLNAIRESGIGICLDDFGTGFSSLNYLRKLPIDILKIDRSFIQDVDTEYASDNLTEDIINIAHKLNIIVIAEGVETESQKAVIAKLGANIVQGFLTGRPLTEEQIRKRYV